MQQSGFLSCIPANWLTCIDVTKIFWILEISHQGSVSQMNVILQQSVLWSQTLGHVMKRFRGGTSMPRKKNVRNSCMEDAKEIWTDLSLRILVWPPACWKVPVVHLFGHVFRSASSDIQVFPILSSVWMMRELLPLTFAHIKLFFLTCTLQGYLIQSSQK